MVSPLGIPRHRLKGRASFDAAIGTIQFFGFHQDISLHDEVLTTMPSTRKMMPITPSSPTKVRLSSENLHTNKQSMASSDPFFYCYYFSHSLSISIYIGATIMHIDMSLGSSYSHCTTKSHFTPKNKTKFDHSSPSSSDLTMVSAMPSAMGKRWPAVGSSW